jgi:predicted N-acyltransferase
MGRENIELIPLGNGTVTPELLNLMYRYYADTNARYGPWGCKYLTETFFNGLPQDFSHRLLLMAAIRKEAPGTPVGLALFVHKKKRLYGRYWGCAEPIDSLHFNTCFYAPIEWAISHGIETFDLGMGAHHKLRRGIPSVGAYSLHRHFNPVLQGIMDHHMGRINRDTQKQIDALNQHLPFAR